MKTYSATVSNQPAQQMACMDVWSGSYFTQRGVEFGGLDAWLYSKPYAQARRGGDVFYASSCATGRITRMLLADVAGHGTAVAASAADLRLLMRRFVNHLDQTEFVRLINRHFAKLTQQNAYATAVITTYFEPTRILTVCNAGHPRPLIYRAAQGQWDVLFNLESQRTAGPRNLPLGVLGISDYDQFDIELQLGDYVVTYTDALIEAQDADGKVLGEQGLLRILRAMGGVEAPQLIPTLLDEIEDRYPENLSRDDVTMVVLRVNQRKPHYSLKEKVWAFLRGAVAPFRAERPPLPDFVLPNVGGPMIPAFERRWHGATGTRLDERSQAKTAGQNL